MRCSASVSPVEVTNLAVESSLGCDCHSSGVQEDRVEVGLEVDVVDLWSHCGLIAVSRQRVGLNTNVSQTVSNFACRAELSLERASVNVRRRRRWVASLISARWLRRWLMVRVSTARLWRRGRRRIVVSIATALIVAIVASKVPSMASPLVPIAWSASLASHSGTGESVEASIALRVAGESAGPCELSHESLAISKRTSSYWGWCTQLNLAELGASTVSDSVLSTDVTGLNSSYNGVSADSLALGVVK